MQAWYKEDEEEASTISTIAIHIKRGSGSRDKLEQEEQLKVYLEQERGDEYIKFIAKFEPAMAGVSYWNKTTRPMLWLVNFSLLQMRHSSICA